jgi:hypothetical protein
MLCAFVYAQKFAACDCFCTRSLVSGTLASRQPHEYSSGLGDMPLDVQCAYERENKGRYAHVLAFEFHAFLQNESVGILRM